MLSASAPLPVATLLDEMAAGMHGPVTREFCSQMHLRSFALLRLPPSMRAEVDAMRDAAAAFFNLSAERKAAVGDFRVVGDTYVGYRDSAACDAEFLELHVTANGRAFPEVSSELSASMVALHRRLSRLGRSLLRGMAAHIGVDPAAFLAPLSPLDSELEGATDPDPSCGPSCEPSKLSSTVLRLCHYRSSKSERGVGGRGVGAICDSSSEQVSEQVSAQVSEQVSEQVLFDEHTDSSLLTLSLLCPNAAALQLADAAAAGDDPWVCVEEGAATLMDLEVHTGDFLAFLTRDFYPACVHRVVRPREDAERVSMPLLLRVCPRHELDTRPYDPLRTNHHLVEIEGVRCRDLGRLLDMRGQRALERRRMAASAEVQRKARAQAYRAEIRAGRALSPVE